MTSTAKYTDQSARRRLRREVPSTAAVLADEQDFRAMRRYRTFTFDDHRSYLRQMEDLLQHPRLPGRAHHRRPLRPGRLRGVLRRHSPSTPTAPTAAAATPPNSPAPAPTLTYQGQPLDRAAPAARRRSRPPGHLGVRLRRPRPRRRLRRSCGEDIGHAAFDRATHALQQLLEAARQPAPTTSSAAPSRPEIRPAGGPARHRARRTPATGSPNRTALVFCTVLAAGLALRSPGGLVFRTTPGHDTTGDRVHGWSALVLARLLAPRPHRRRGLQRLLHRRRHRRPDRHPSTASTTAPGLPAHTATRTPTTTDRPAHNEGRPATKGGKAPRHT